MIDWRTPHVKVHSIGRNVIITASSDGPVYTYMYNRTIYDGSSEYPGCWTTFSHNLDELKTLMNKELDDHKGG
jgi:hypothetical protein